MDGSLDTGGLRATRAARPHASRSVAFLVTAEHGGNRVPGPHRALFRDAGPLLASHRGWDPGSLDLARRLSERIDAPLVHSTVTRLLVDLNRSPHNPRVFSERTRGLARAERDELLDRWHRPHWASVQEALDRAAPHTGPVVHLSIHTFTPVLDGVVRRPDLALLYDPRREGERALAAAWARALGELAPDHPIGRNDPYRGNADGLTTAQRRVRGAEEYVGIEVEVNQRLLDTSGAFPGWVARVLSGSLARALDAVAWR